MDRLVRLQHTLETEIPITVAIGLRVAAYDNGMLLLAAPLAPNINHKDSVFAGSINAVVTLAGWSLLWCLLDQATLRGKIVIQDSTIQYLRPVTQYLRPVTKDFVARCYLPAEAQVNRFLKVLGSKSRARLELHAEIWEAHTLAVNFTGRYVVQLTPA
jgi:hypothetical protein